MSTFFKIFTLLIGVDVFLMPLGSILGQSGVGDIFFHLFKISFICMFVVIGIFHLKFKVRINSISLLFLVFGLVAFLNGLYSNPVGKAFFSHIYGFILPLLGMSFGSYFYEYSSAKDVKLFHKVLKYSFYILATLTIVYYILFSMGIINYFGMATRWPYLAAYALSNNKFLLFFSALILVIMTGKRSMLLQYAVFLIVYFLQSKKNSILALTWKMKVPVILAGACFVALGIYQGVFYRFEPILNIDFTDDDALYIATSGRSAEVLGVLSHIKENNVSWLLGAGFGEVFTFEAGLGDGTYTYKAHYSHFSPLYLMLIYGLPFTILFYLLVIKIFFSAFFKIKDVFYYIALGGFVSSFLSAILLVDLQFWFFLGGLMQASKMGGDKGKFNLWHTGGSSQNRGN